MPLVGGFVFPHGTITLDPDTRDLSEQPAYLPTTKENCIKLHEAMKNQAEILVGTNPDLIIYTTPHGLKLNKSFLFVKNAIASGSASWNGDWTEFKAEIGIDVDTGNKLVEALEENGNLVESLSFASSDFPLPLAWAEVVPFWFISEAYKSAGLLPPKAIPIGIPTRRSTTPTSVFIPELLKLGGDIWSFIKEQKDLRIAFVVSCDLSHYHSKDPTSPYEFNEDAVPFDNFCVDWAQLDLNLEEVDGSNGKLLQEGGGSLADHIGSCGYTGLVILQGVLTSCVKDVEEGKSFKANFLEYSWPTYYGMMVNHFLAN